MRQSKSPCYSMAMCDTAFSPHVLAGTELFAGLPPSGLAEAMAAGRLRRFAQGTTIFVQGTEADRSHLLLEGHVRILQTDKAGAQIVVRFVGPKEIFGTVALFTDGRYPAHAVAATDCTEIGWPKPALLSLMARYPNLNLVKVIGNRLRETQDRLREIATQRVERRIANALLRLAAQGGKAGTKGMAIDFPLSRKDVAEICGATLHTASRTLKAWEKQGLIRTDRQRVTICEMSEIRRRAEDRS